MEKIKNSKIITLTFAHKLEYKGILGFTKIIQITNYDKNIILMKLEYKNKIIHLLQTGIGKHSTTKALDLYLSTYSPDIIYNFGTAGAININLELFETVNVENIYLENNPQPILIPIFQKNDCKIVNLLTVEKPIISNDSNKTINGKIKFDIVDMESYYIAKKAKEKNILINIIKVISDNANDDTTDSFKQNINKCSKKLIELIKTNWLSL